MIRKGSHDAAGLKFAIVQSRFNSVVTDSLLAGALKALREHGCPESDVAVAQVPGAVELPLFVELFAERGEYAAVIALGAIVRGETQHHHYISQSVVDALQEISVRRHIPVALGLLTTDNMSQALQRAADDPGNKGYEAAMTAIETANLQRELRKPAGT
jgi:6,7-dimethyl-8-ribityllumazine synthase